MKVMEATKVMVGQKVRPKASGRYLITFITDGYEHITNMHAFITRAAL